MIGRYQTARAFRAALEDRLKQMVQSSGVDLMRLRRQVAFDRILARLFADSMPPWVLKGGYTFELRLGGAARATKDLDLSLLSMSLLKTTDATTAPSTIIREALQDAADCDLRDGFTFRIGEAMADLDAAPYGGARYPVEARLDARIFTTFHLDVGVGDAIITPLEWLIGQDTLSFADIPTMHAAALSREQQFAEKLHAYTLPRGERVNTRVKDLVDLILLIDLGLPDQERMRQALHATFERRRTHTLPATLEPPPRSWRLPYSALAEECHLVLTEMGAAFTLVSTYYQTIVAARQDGSDG